jgi:hypothetical protein
MNQKIDVKLNDNKLRCISLKSMCDDYDFRRSGSTFSSDKDMSLLSVTSSPVSAQ